MIERLQSKKGHAIAKLNSRFVCSSVDPIKEAEDWVHKLGRRVQDIKSIIVLGAGCGYHLACLRRLAPGSTILALDFESELLGYAESIHPLEWADIRKTDLSKTPDLATNTDICRAVKDSYVVVTFAPATLHERQKYADIELFLLGRTWAGFQFVSGERSRLSGLFQNTVHALPVDSNSLLSIKSLCERLSSQECRESMLLKALRELVV